MAEYTGERWEDALYHLLLIGKSNPRLRELLTLEQKNKQLRISDKYRIIEQVYLFSSVEAMRTNLSSRVQLNQYTSIALEVSLDSQNLPLENSGQHRKKTVLSLLCPKQSYHSAIPVGHDFEAPPKILQRPPNASQNPKSFVCRELGEFRGCFEP